MDSSTKEDHWLTRREAAKYLGYSSAKCLTATPDGRRGAHGYPLWKTSSLDAWAFEHGEKAKQRARAAKHRTKVYFAHAPSNGLVKIGKTTELRKRLIRLRSQSPVEVVILGTCDGTKGAEAKLHEIAAGRRRHGEWFSFTPEEVELIRAALNPRGGHTAELVAKRVAVLLGRICAED